MREAVLVFDRSGDDVGDDHRYHTKNPEVPEHDAGEPSRHRCRGQITVADGERCHH